MIELTRSEINLIRHAMYMHRQTVREQERLALDEVTDTAKRDADRFSKIISLSLRVEDKLTDALAIASV